MATVRDILGRLRSLDQMELVVLGESLTKDGQINRKDFLDWAKTSEGKKFLKSEVIVFERELQDQAYNQLVREFGDASAGGAVRVKGDRSQIGVERPQFSVKEVNARKREILTERLDDLQIKASVAKKIRSGEITDAVAIAREQDVFAQQGVTETDTRTKKSERTSRFSQKIENRREGRPASIQSQLERNPRADYGGSSNITYTGRSPEGTVGEPPKTTVIRKEFGRDRAEAYDIVIDGDDVRTVSRKRFADKEPTRRSRNLASGRRTEIQTGPRAELSALRREVGGVEPLENVLSVRDIPKKDLRKIEAFLPPAGNFEIYKMAGGYRVISPGFLAGAEVAYTPTAYMVNAIGADERKQLIGNSKNLTHKIKRVGGVRGMDPEEIPEHLKKIGAVEIKKDSSIAQIIKKKIASGQIDVPEGKNFKFYKIPEGSGFMMVLDKSSEAAIPGDVKPTALKRSIQTREGSAPKIKTQIRGDRKGSGVSAFRKMEDKAAGGVPLRRFEYEGMDVGETNAYVRKIVRQRIIDNKTVAEPELPDLEGRHPLLAKEERLKFASAQSKVEETIQQRVDEAIRRDGPLKILEKDLALQEAEFKKLARANPKAINSAQLARIEDLRATVTNFRARGLQADEVLASLGGSSKMGAFESLDDTLNDLRDLVETRTSPLTDLRNSPPPSEALRTQAGLPSTRSKQISGFARRMPKIPGPAGSALKLAELLRKIT